MCPQGEVPELYKLPEMHERAHRQAWRIQPWGTRRPGIGRLESSPSPVGRTPIRQKQKGLEERTWSKERRSEDLGNGAPLKDESQETSCESQETIGELKPTGGNRKIVSFRVMYLRAGDEKSELERIFRESQMFLKYF